VATLVCFHAHPDDECISTGGVMAGAARRGHRVVLVVATGGELGEAPDDLAPGETLVDRRRDETMKSANVLGIHRIVWLGYRDSGMAGWEQNNDPACFSQADVDEAAARFAAVLIEEAADVVTVYDANGLYGHPDHIQVHHVGHRGAELAGTPVVYESTMNRDEARRFVAEAIERGDMQPEDLPEVDDEHTPFGTPEAELTTRVDVGAFVDVKRDSIACHASQVTDTTFFLQMGPDAFAGAFGVEWYVRQGAPPGIHETELADLGPTS